ncbi:MAG TPA: SRPBCC family protein [Candidatus Limnocylindria bacterium]
MKRVERTARIGAPPASVFAYLADLDNLAEWQTGVISAELTPNGEVGVGSTARVVRQLMGQRVEAPLTITAYEPPSRLVIGSEVSGVRAVAELDLQPADGATDLRFAMEIRASGMTRFMEPMIASAAGGDIDESIRRVQERFAATG